MYLGVEAEAAQHSRPDVAQPQARTGHILVPEVVATRKDDIHPEHMARTEEDTTTTGTAPDQVASGGPESTFVRYPPSVPLGAAEHQRRMIDLMDENPPGGEAGIPEKALGDISEGPIALPVVHAVWPATRSR